MLALLSLSLVSTPLKYTASQLANFEITALPGAPTVPWKQFSGYLDVGSRG
jgi:hypothetical protein